MRYRIVVIGLAVLVALALQVGELSAYVSPVEQPAPPRPTPPPDAIQQNRAKPSGHSQSKSEPSEPVLTRASVDGMSLVWAMVWESK